jgi:hypothetical protein
LSKYKNNRVTFSSLPEQSPSNFESKIKQDQPHLPLMYIKVCAVENRGCMWGLTHKVRQNFVLPHIQPEYQVKMTPRDEEGDDPRSRSSKQQQYSTSTHLNPDQKKELTKALSLRMIRHPVLIPVHAPWSSVSLFVPREVQEQAKVEAVFRSDSNLQGRVYPDPDGEPSSSLVSEDRFLNTMISTTPPSSTTLTRVSRFEDIFAQMRKENHVALEAPSNAIVPSKFHALGSWVQHKDSINSSREVLQSNHVTARSQKSLHSRRSSGTEPSISLKVITNAENSNPAPTREQEILQMANWRGPARMSQGDGSTEVLASDYARSESEEMVSCRSRTIAAKVRATQVAIENKFGPGTLRAFHPSHRALQQNGLLPERDIRFAAANSTRSNSPTNYLGDPSVEHNRSAFIPENENCSLWVWGLPACVTYTALLASIRGIGKVYATVINPPTDEIRTSAAKVVLFNRQGAERLFNIIANRQFVVMGKLVHRVLWNKIRSGPYPHLNHSRAIRITGPRELMDFDFFEDFFIRRFTYDLDRRGVVQCNRPGLVCHEWHFGSLRCQAASAKTAIERELKGIYEVEWADDPCVFP